MRFHLPQSLKNLGSGSFAKCSLQISIPPSVEKINYATFADCKSLDSFEIKIPDSLQIIKAHSFKKCSSLSQILIPSKIEVENNAFSKNTKIQK